MAADYVSEMTEFTEPCVTLALLSPMPLESNGSFHRITAILVWRFMLDLHESANDDVITDSKLDAMVEGDWNPPSCLQFDAPDRCFGGSCSPPISDRDDTGDVEEATGKSGAAAACVQQPITS